MVAQQERSRNEIQLAGNHKTLKNMLEAAKGAIGIALPKHMTPDRMIRVASVAVSRSYMLQKCTVESIVKCVMVSSQLGLDCSGVLGSAYMVPFWNNKLGAFEAQLIPGYRGLIDLARRSNQIASIEARVVYAGEHFEYEQGLNQKLVHKPDLDAAGDDEKPREVRLVYAIAKFKDVDSDPQVEVMSRAAVDAIRSRSKGYQDYLKKQKEGKDPQPTPWVSDYEEMARKTVVKRLCKYLPLSVEFANAVEIDNHVSAGEAMPEMVDGLLVGPGDSGDDDPAPPTDGKSNFGFDCKPAEGKKDEKPVEKKPEESKPVQSAQRGPAAPLDEPGLNPQNGSQSGPTNQTQSDSKGDNEGQQQQGDDQSGPKIVEKLPDHADWNWIIDYAAMHTPKEMALTVLEVKQQLMIVPSVKVDGKLKSLPTPWGKLTPALRQELLDNINAGIVQWKPGKAASPAAE